MKDRIKMSIAISVLLVVIIVVILIIIQYQIEGEKNMPYQLSKITIISTAEGEQNTENPEMKNKCERLLMELTGLRESEEIREDVEFYIKDALESLDMEDEENGILQLFLEG